MKAALRSSKAKANPKVRAKKAAKAPKAPAAMPKPIADRINAALATNGHAEKNGKPVLNGAAH